MDFLYNTVLGRILLCFMQKSGILKLAAAWLESDKSCWYIDRFIKKNNVDMRDFENQRFKSFAEFFARKKELQIEKTDDNVLISPCDSLLSVYHISENRTFCVKDSLYRFEDLVPEPEMAEQFKDGLCMIFRLEARDYHHFCYVDDGVDSEAKFIPGLLHSVQPVALEQKPVFRQNRRYYHLFSSNNFGPVMQIEVGAVLVGDVHHCIKEGPVCKGEEAGYFRLCGSTIILMFDKNFRNRFSFKEDIEDMLEFMGEYPLSIGERLGTVNRS